MASRLLEVSVGVFQMLRTAGVILAICFTASAANAQTKNKFALGATWDIRNPAFPDEAQGTKDIGLLWRFGHSQSGWNFNWGLNWYATDLSQSIAGKRAEVGELKLRPIMAGYGYDYVF